MISFKTSIDQKDRLQLIIYYNKNILSQFEITNNENFYKLINVIESNNWIEECNCIFNPIDQNNFMKIMLIEEDSIRWLQFRIDRYNSYDILLTFEWEDCNSQSFKKAIQKIIDMK